MTSTENSLTRQRLLEHADAYPKLQIRDVFKFLYQSAFGCEHLVSSLEGATEYIKKEYETLHPSGEPKIEPLDGNYSRVPLSVIAKGLSHVTLGKLFVASAKREENGIADLTCKLEAARELIQKGLLPFDENDFEKELAAWEADGFCALHHSDAFREEYKPSYRVISNEFAPFIEFFAELDKRAGKKTVVAIEGGSASGKTTLAEIVSTLYDCTVFHMDDFFLQPHQRTPERFMEVGGNVDRKRMLSEVLIPLRESRSVCYRRFDCSTMSLGKECRVTPKELTVIEGAYSMHKELEGYYDLSLLLDITPELQKKRIEKRNSPKLAERFFNEWIPLENTYFEKTNIRSRCSMTVKIS